MEGSNSTGLTTSFGEGEICASPQSYDPAPSSPNQTSDHSRSSPASAFRRQPAANYMPQLLRLCCETSTIAEDTALLTAAMTGKFDDQTRQHADSY
jgi:hypothetical protein